MTLKLGSDGEMLRLHSFLPLSYANGPGARAVVWVQGCTLGCRGCFNPETHLASGGTLVSVKGLVETIAANVQAEGVSILGGEPLQQYRPVMSLLKSIRANTKHSVLLFTGYTWEEVRQMPDADDLLACVDILFAGRYDQCQRVAHHLLGSANKTVHFLTERYSMDDLVHVPEAEVIVDSSGEIVLSGIDPLIW